MTSIGIDARAAAGIERGVVEQQRQRDADVGAMVPPEPRPNDEWRTYDRPCRECRHARQRQEYWLCARLTMAIRPELRVNYVPERPVEMGGLCFQDARRK